MVHILAVQISGMVQEITRTACKVGPHGGKSKLTSFNLCYERPLKECTIYIMQGQEADSSKEIDALQALVGTVSISRAREGSNDDEKQ